MFSNGQKLVMAQIALANFNNPMGLEKIGEHHVTGRRPTPAWPRSAPRTPAVAGSCSAASLEMSNVDLAQEFTNLIIAQRGFQANSRVITTSDQMLQDLVDLKR